MAGFGRRLNQLNKVDNFGQNFDNAFGRAMRANDKPRPVSPNIKPSKTMCLRQMYYILTGTNVDGNTIATDTLILIQKNGTAMHRVIQEQLASAESCGIKLWDPNEAVARAIALGSNLRIKESPWAKDNPYETHCHNDDYDLSFMFDGVASFAEKTMVLEIKTEDHYKFKARTMPDKSHVKQAIHYSFSLVLDQILFMYVDRNYYARKLYVVDVTERMIFLVKHRIRLAQYLVSQGIVPSKCDDSKACQYCQYQGQCRRDGDKTEEGLYDPAKIIV